MNEELNANNLADAMVVEPEDEDTGEDQETDESEMADSDSDDAEQEADQGAEDDDPVKSLRAEMDEFKKTAEKEKGSMERKLTDLEKENKRLGYALRKAEKGSKKDEDKTEFTDAQLHQMMKDHHDDPDVLFQIVKQMARQSGDSAAKTAETKAEIKTKRKELESITEKTFPGALKEGSPVFDGVQQTMRNYGLEDHPYGDVLGLSLMTLNNLPTMVKNIEEQTKKQVLGKASDKKRKDKIKGNTLADKGSKIAPVKLSPEANETADRLKMNKRQRELYKKFLGGGKKSAVVQAGV